MNTINENKMGTLQNQKAAPYDFTIGSVISEAWARVKGMKASVWGAFGFIYLVCLAFIFPAMLADFALPKIPAQVIGAILYIAFIVIVIALRVGLYYLGVRRSVDLPVRAKSIFSMLRFAGKFIGLVMLQFIIVFILTLLIALPFMFFHYPTLSGLPFIILSIYQAILGLFIFYIALSFMFSYFLVVEKSFSIFAAFTASFFAFSQHWFKIIITILVMGIILFISAIPLLIGLIWTLPMLINVFGILYRTAFGVEEARIQREIR